MTTQPVSAPRTFDELLTLLKARADDISAAPVEMSNEEAQAWAAGVGDAADLLTEFLTDHPARTDAQTATELRKRAVDIDRLPTYDGLGLYEDPQVEPDDESPAYPYISDELRRIADALDTGTGPRAHHGCYNQSIPAGKCTECRMVEDAEIDDPSYIPSTFTPPAQRPTPDA